MFLNKMEEHIYFYSKTSNKDYFPLTNFYIGSRYFKLRDLDWKTVEHYFQAAKFFNTEPQYAEQIRKCRLSKEAKKLAWANSNIDPNWDSIRDSVMLDALRAKFNQCVDANRILMKTGDAYLHEDSPVDMYWGVKGRDRLGQLLMQVREEIKERERGRKEN